MFELLIDGYPLAFHADIERYSPPGTSDKALLEIQHNTINKAFQAQYGLISEGSDELIFMEDHLQIDEDGRLKTLFTRYRTTGALHTHVKTHRVQLYYVEGKLRAP